MVNNLDWLGRAGADRLPARHRQALHDPVHARQGLGPGPPGARPVVHRVQLHAAAGVRLRPPAPDDGRRAADGRRRPVGQHHRRPRAHPADERARARTPSPPTAWPTSCCCRRRARSSARARAASRSGWTRRGRRRIAFYQYWLNTDDRDVGTYLRWFTEFPRERDRGARGRGGARAPRRGRPSGRWRSTSRRGPTAPRRPRPGDRRFARRSSRPGRSTIRRCSRRSSRRPAGSSSIRRGWRPGRAVLLAEAGVFASRGEARRMIAGGGVTVNGERVDATRTLRSRSRSPGSGSTSGSASVGARSDAARGGLSRSQRA